MDKKYRWERLTASGKVSPDPVSIGIIILAPNHANHAVATIYDGESTSDPLLMTIQSSVDESKAINFSPPLETLRGLYIDFTSQCNEVMLCYGSPE